MGLRIVKLERNNVDCPEILEDYHQTIFVFNLNNQIRHISILTEGKDVNIFAKYRFIFPLKTTTSHSVKNRLPEKKQLSELTLYYMITSVLYLVWHY